MWFLTVPENHTLPWDLHEEMILCKKMNDFVDLKLVIYIKMQKKEILVWKKPSQCICKQINVFFLILKKYGCIIFLIKHDLEGKLVQEKPVVI